jgi:hypothetical protein
MFRISVSRMPRRSNTSYVPPDLIRSFASHTTLRFQWNDRPDAGRGNASGRVGHETERGANTPAPRPRECPSGLSNPRAGWKSKSSCSNVDRTCYCCVISASHPKSVASLPLNLSALPKQRRYLRSFQPVQLLLQQGGGARHRRGSRCWQARRIARGCRK